MGLYEMEQKVRAEFDPIRPQVKDIYKQMQKVLDYLWSRWQDEKEYEDFQEYIDYAKAKLEEIATKHNYIISDIKMSKRPFGVAYTIGNFIIQMSVTSRAYEWKIIGIK